MTTEYQEPVTTMAGTIHVRCASSLEQLAALLRYPREHLVPRANLCLSALTPVLPQAAAHLRCFAATLANSPLTTLQDAYVAAFDFDPASTLEIGWHLYGESCDRGGFLAAIRERLAQHGIVEDEGLPDHLSHLLKLIACEPVDRAAALANRIQPAIEGVRAALVERHSLYADLLSGIALTLAAISDGSSPEATAP